MADLRIAFLVNRFPVLTETFILNQISGLLDHGHRVDVISRSAASSGPAEATLHERNLDLRATCLNIPRAALHRRSKLLALLPILAVRHPVIVWRVFSMFARDRSMPIVDVLYFLRGRSRIHGHFDIVHGQFGPLGATAVALRDLGLLEGKVVTSFRGYDLSLHLRRYGTRIYRRLLDRGDLFLASCDFYRSRLVGELGADEKKVVVHRSGIEIAVFDGPPRPIHDSRPTRVLAVGRLVPKKGVEYAIRAAARVVERCPDVEYAIIGDGVLRGDLEALVRDLRLEDHVTFLGARSHREVVEHLRRASLLVAPSVTGLDGDQEGIPNTAKEAMALGLPVIATRHAGLPELVEDGRTGFLVPERDVEALAARTVELLADPRRRDVMGRAGQRFVRENYDADVLNDRLVGLYHRLL